MQITKTRLRTVAAGVLALVLLTAYLSPGFVPHGQAAAGDVLEESLAISVDGIAPVGEAYAIPVGSRQDFTALRIGQDTGSRLAAVGDVEWSLSAGKAASLTAYDGDFTVAVTAAAPGEGALYLTAPDGLVDVVRLKFYCLDDGEKESSDRGAVSIVAPRDGSKVVFQQGAVGVPMAIAGDLERSLLSDQVRFTLDDYYVGTAAARPFVVTYRDVAGLLSWTRHRIAANAVGTESEYTAVSKPVAFEVVPMDADGNRDGLPEDPFALGLAPGDVWLAHVDSARTESAASFYPTSKRHVAIVAFSSALSPAPSAIVQDPDNPARIVTVRPSEGMLYSNEIGLLVVVVCDTLDGMAAPASLPPLPAYEPLAQGRFVFVSVLVSGDRGQTFDTIDPDRFAHYPLLMEMHGVPVVSGDNVRFLTYPGDLVNAGTESGLDIRLDLFVHGDWMAAPKGSRVEAGVVSTLATAPGIFAPFRTPARMRILSLWNAATGVPQGFSIGGDIVEVAVVDVPPGLVPRIEFDGIPARPVQAANPSGLVFTVATPRAARQDKPVFAQKVDVHVYAPNDPLNSDTLADGFTYVGPEITSIEPDAGPQSGGASVLVRGDGFDDVGISARLGGAAVVGIRDVSRTAFRGTTSAREPGIVDIEVRTANGFIGTVPALYRYLRDELDAAAQNGIVLDSPTGPGPGVPDGTPRVARIEPGIVWAYGGTVAHILGTGFVPEAGARTRVLFNGMEAPYPPEGAGYAQSTTDLYVVVPPLAEDFMPEADEVRVEIALLNPDGNGVVYPDCFTYVRRDQRRETVAGGMGGALAYEGDVLTWTVAFDAASGSGPRTLALDPSNDSDTVLLEIPPVSEEWTGPVFALVRATRDFHLFGLDRIEAGEPVEGVWAFDMHLYRGEYPFDELDVAFDLRRNPIVLDFPVSDETGMPLVCAGDVRTGGLTLYRMDTRLTADDFFHTDGWCEVDLAGHVQTAFQWNVGAQDVSPEITRGTSSKDPVYRIRCRLDRPGSFALRKEAFLPAELALATRYSVSPEGSKSGSYAGGSEVVITGRGLAWPDRIRFGEVTAFLKRSNLENRLLYASDTELRVLSPAVAKREHSTAVDIIIEAPQGKGKQPREIVLPKQFTFGELGLLGTILAALLALPVALIGLFAGGKSGGGGGGPCFIASAAYGTPLAEQIDVLRAVRDQFMLTNALGTACVDVYYRVSPPIAEVIAAHPFLAMCVRAILWPIVAVSRGLLACPQVGGLTVAAAISAAMIRVRRRYRIRCRRHA